MKNSEYNQAKKEFLAFKPIFANSYTIMLKSFRKAEASGKTDETYRNMFVSDWERYKTNLNEVRHGEQ